MKKSWCSDGLTQKQSLMSCHRSGGILFVTGRSLAVRAVALHGEPHGEAGDGAEDAEHGDDAVRPAHLLLRHQIRHEADHRAEDHVQREHRNQKSRAVQGPILGGAADVLHDQPQRAHQASGQHERPPLAKGGGAAVAEKTGDGTAELRDASEADERSQDDALQALVHPLRLGRQRRQQVCGQQRPVGEAEGEDAQHSADVQLRPK
eukprot:scaffold1610_cov257-Pinguiococcus_pyrenoidosus.AAC.50